MTPKELYQKDVNQGLIQKDVAQENAIQHLQKRYDELTAKKGWFAKKELIKGLYMWGGVGRGKTYLMDLFFKSLPFENKMRMHFYRFMQRIHNELRALQGKENPLQLVAKKIAKEAKILCFDEFLVIDIADAMILGLLFQYLFEEKVCLVTTSNVPPNKLYEGGLQREQFLPAIKLLEENTEVINVDSGKDYRVNKFNLNQHYYYPLVGEHAFMQAHFDALKNNEPLLENSFKINNRDIRAIARTSKVVWFDFKELCEGPRGQIDYIELAKNYQFVLISHVPQFDLNKDNEARRFIGLIDEFYDNKIKLILSAEVTIEELYKGSRLGFEFKRTISRLQEMQSQNYWGLSFWT